MNRLALCPVRRTLLDRHRGRRPIRRAIARRTSARRRPGAFAQYVMKIEGQPDIGSTVTRLPDENGQQRVQVRIEYQAAGTPSVAFTDYVLKSGYSLESDALGYGKALVAMSSSAPGAKPTVMPAAVLDNARKTMPDYAASAVFVGTDNIGGKDSGHYRYVQRHPGNPETIETGEIWLNETVPFGLVKQKAVTAEANGKVVSRFEMLLVDSGNRAAPASAPTAWRRRRRRPRRARRRRSGAVGSSSPCPSCRPAATAGRLSIGFRNKTDSVLRLAIPAGATNLDVGSPLETLKLVAPVATALEIAPGATSKPVLLSQTGHAARDRRRIRGHGVRRHAAVQRQRDDGLRRALARRGRGVALASGGDERLHAIADRVPPTARRRAGPTSSCRRAPRRSRAVRRACGARSRPVRAPAATHRRAATPSPSR